MIALAGGANAGSAATIIGNPQNILIGEVGELDFWQFLVACAPPALAGLACVHLVVWWQWRKRFAAARNGGAGQGAPALERPGLLKAALATLLLLILFATPLPQVEGVLLVAGYLLISRRLATRTMLGLVDWHLLVLFGGLFVVTHALAATGLPEAALAWLLASGLGLDQPRAAGAAHAGGRELDRQRAARGPAARDRTRPRRGRVLRARRALDAGRQPARGRQPRQHHRRRARARRGRRPVLRRARPLRRADDAALASCSRWPGWCRWVTSEI